MAVYNKWHNSSLNKANGTLELPKCLSREVHYTPLNINNKEQFGYNRETGNNENESIFYHAKWEQGLFFVIIKLGTGAMHKGECFTDMKL